YCSKDAVETWQAWKSFGMPPENGRLLIDEQATKENIIAALQWLARVAGPEDRVVLFYSGHGTQEPNGASANREPDKAQEYLAPYNSQNANFDFDLADDRIGELLDAVPAQVQVVVLDACYAGGFRQELERHEGRMVLMASQENQTSGESTKFKGGLLVGVVLQALREFAPQGVPAGEVVRAARLRVARICPECFADMGGSYRRCPECGTVLTGDQRAQQAVVTSTLAAELPLQLGHVTTQKRPIRPLDR
ncbi:MAG TPA: caspase family protein, partial [bacterium]|nr:caspase family protein [bacterium]